MEHRKQNAHPAVGLGNSVLGTFFLVEKIPKLSWFFVFSIIYLPWSQIINLYGILFREKMLF